MTKLSITIVQSHLYWENPKKNREHLELLLSATQQTDLIILPELFSTAFSVSCNGEPMNGDSMKWMSSLAKEKKASVVGSLIISENNHKYNRLIWMNADGTYQYYDKRHLFGMMQEESYFKAAISTICLMRVSFLSSSFLILRESLIFFFIRSCLFILVFYLFRLNNESKFLVNIDQLYWVFISFMFSIISFESLLSKNFNMAFFISCGLGLTTYPTLPWSNLYWLWHFL